MEVLMRGAVRSLFVAASLLVAASAGAQPVSENNIEVGGGLGGVVSWWIPPQPGGDVRVTFPINRRFAIDALVAMAPARDGATYGLYGALVRQRMVRRATRDVQPFVSYGVVGIFGRRHVDEYRYRDAAGATVVMPEYNDTVVSPPFIGMLGGGVERRVHARLSVRAEAQMVMALVLPVGVRIAAGVSVSVGRLAHAPAEVVSR
jgi:hypothetical protein